MLFFIVMPGRSYSSKLHAARLELGHLGFHVGDLPYAWLALDVPALLGLVQEHLGAPHFVDHASGVCLLGLEPTFSS